MRRLCTLLIALTCGILLSLPAWQADGAIVGPRRVLLGAAHNAFFGANLSGAEFSSYTFPSASDWAYLKANRVKYVRLPIAWENLQTTLLGTLNATYLAAIKTALASASANGIGVIVDLHNYGQYCSSGWGSTCTYAGNGGSSGSGVNVLGDGTLGSTQLNDVWTKLVTALAGTPGLIGYGLMNEPSSNIIGTNLLATPNGFGSTSSVWFPVNGAVLTQLASGSNPLGTGYGPAWSLTGGTGFGGTLQDLTLSAVEYTVSCYSKVPSGGNVVGSLIIGAGSTTFTATTTWQRFSFSYTPTAGSQLVGISLNNPSTGTIDVANCQLETGGTASTYQPSPYTPYAQAAVTAIRVVDANTPIYICGLGFSTASAWTTFNYEMALMTGGNLAFEGHQYYDGVQGIGGGGTYSGNYSSYSINTSTGTQALAPFLAWGQQTGVKLYVGETGIPNSTADANANWFTVQGNVETYLKSAGIPMTMWLYGNAAGQSGNTLNIAPKTGVTDPRFSQLIAY